MRLRKIFAHPLEIKPSIGDNRHRNKQLLVLEMSRLTIVIVPLLSGFILLGGFVVWAQRPDPPPQPNQNFRSIAPPQTGQVSSAPRIREGTAFRNMLVNFRQNGDRIVLYTVEGNQRYTCHENLALERIWTASQASPDRQYWRIDGVFTEFRGENYVTIRSYVIASSPAVVP